jgi:hypothetical protein
VRRTAQTAGGEAWPVRPSGERGHTGSPRGRCRARERQPAPRVDFHIQHCVRPRCIRSCRPHSVHCSHKVVIARCRNILLWQCANQSKHSARTRLQRARPAEDGEAVVREALERRAHVPPQLVRQQQPLHARKPLHNAARRLAHGVAEQPIEVEQRERQVGFRGHAHGRVGVGRARAEAVEHRGETLGAAVPARAVEQARERSCARRLRVKRHLRVLHARAHPLQASRVRIRTR